MGTEQAGHVLVIALDQDEIKVAHQLRYFVDPKGREFWDWHIRCEQDPGDFSRSCVTWFQCECTLTREQREVMWRNGDEGPCPQSSTGWHREQVGEYRIVVHPDADTVEFELAEILLGTIPLPGGDSRG